MSAGNGERLRWPLMAYLTVVAEIVAKPGKEEELRRELLALIEPTRKEEGCVQYDLHQSADEPGRFLFYENWRTRATWDKHMQTPHLERFQSIAGDLAEPLRVLTYSRLR